MTIIQILDKHLPWLLDLLALGGEVLVVILVVTTIMWGLILERIFYVWFVHPRKAKKAYHLWQARSEHHSWAARHIRQAIISKVSMALDKHLMVLGALVALCPLLGLMGTVMGMLEVFDVMAATGSNNARATAAGVSKATISTLAGMVSALSGLLLVYYLKRTAAVAREQLAEHLPLSDSKIQEPS